MGYIEVSGEGMERVMVKMGERTTNKDYVMRGESE